MNRQEFMAQLSRLLMDIDEQEREAALEYYESYFDDAGEENEDKVIQELGSPGKVAAMIKADLKQDAGYHGEYTEYGYEDVRFREAKQTPEASYRKKESKEEEWTEAGSSQQEYQYQDFGTLHQKPRRGAGTWALIIVALVFAIPVILGLLGGALGILGGAFGLLAGLIGTIVGFVGGGMGLLIKGIGGLFVSPATGLIQLGAGLLLLAVGILCIVLLVMIFVKWLPWLVRHFINWIQRVIHHGKRGDPV